ncbi:MAG: O-antigen ligase family protein [Patescibacteria group bacterium]|nr:O-antigen ligase family protein [Patescibacteria group bacterium]
MGVLKIIFALLILSFPIAEIGRFQFPNGVAFSINDIFLIVLIVPWIVYHLLNKKKIKRNILTKPILIFICISLISLVLNMPHLSVMNLLVSFLYLLRWTMYASIFFIVREFDKKFKNKIPYLMLFSGGMVVLGGYIQYFFYPSLRNLFYLGWDEHLYRMFSSFLDPNFAGTFFVIFFIFILGLIYQYFKNSLISKAIALSLINFFVLIAVYLTYSRSAFIMLILSLSIFLFLVKKWKLIIFTLVGLLLIVFIVPKSFQTEGTNLFRTFSSQQRIESSQVAIKIFQDSPVFGVGFNAYRYAQNKYGLNNEIWQITHSGAGTDNSFLFVLATTGIVGLASYIYLIKSIFALAKVNFRDNVFSLILFSSLAGLIFNSFFINSLFYVLIFEWIWIVASLIENK